MRLIRHVQPKDYDHAIEIHLLMPWDHHKGWWGFGQSGAVWGKVFQEKTRFSLGPVAVWFTACHCAVCNERRHRFYEEREVSE
jgi:hypothetical protein